MANNSSLKWRSRSASRQCLQTQMAWVLLLTKELASRGRWTTSRMLQNRHLLERVDNSLRHCRVMGADNIALLESAISGLPSWNGTVSVFSELRSDAWWETPIRHSHPDKFPLQHVPLRTVCHAGSFMHLSRLPLPQL